MIDLQEASIDQALREMARAVDTYRWLQATLAIADVSHDREFQTRFNAFYRVRRNAAWRSAFYGLLEEQKSRRRSFGAVLRHLGLRLPRTGASGVDVEESA